MVQRPSAVFDVEVIVDFTSPSGADATHMRGTMLVNSLDNLRAMGLYDRYLALLPASHRDVIPYTIAASWIPIELAVVHYEACDAMSLHESQLKELGEMMAKRVADTFLATALRATRNAGLEALWTALKQIHRLNERMYQGGALTVFKTGPKDMVLEHRGLPLVTSRHWRAAYIHYMNAVGCMFTKVAYVKLTRPQVPHPHTIAVSLSWV